MVGKAIEHNVDSVVILEKQGALATVTLNRPEKLNALTQEMRELLASIAAEINEDKNIEVVLLKANGQAFCAGADLIDSPDEPLAWRRRVQLAQRQHFTFSKMDKIVVAAVQGPAVGGGAALAFSADIVLMADDAHFSFPFVHIGFTPDGGMGYFLTKKLGPAMAMDLLLTGDSLNAIEAKSHGLTRRVVPAVDLQHEAEKLCQQLLKTPHEALMLTKNLCHQSWANELDCYLGHEANAIALAASTASHRQALTRLRARLQARK